MARRYTPKRNVVPGILGKVIGCVGKPTKTKAQALVEEADGTVLTRHIVRKDGAWWACVGRYDNGDMDVQQVEHE